MSYMWIKRYLPKSLFGRALLILIIPVVLIQMLMAYIFYDRHWQNVTRYMSSALAGETAYLVTQLRHATTSEKNQLVHDFELTTQLDVTLLAGEYITRQKMSGDFASYRLFLAQKIDEPFVVRRMPAGDMIEVDVQLEGQVLRIRTTAKRLESPTTSIFLIWMVGSTVCLLLIAILFLRNQIRPISRLAEAADNFGRGMDTPNFRPHGSTEVRMAARAFIIMRERIKRQIRTRTDMLSGISHDLRTPLTRMKLQLAMLGDSEAISELSADVQQMEHMITEYLEFARGEGGEEAIATRLDTLLADIVEDYRRASQPVTYVEGDAVEMMLRPNSFRRVMTNILDNAIRYGTHAYLSYQCEGNNVRIMVDDEGDGIHQEWHEEVFRPFSRLDASRNSKTGGVGLGLTIARDIAIAHGGSIHLAESPQGGLRVIISLPLGKI